MNSLLRGCSTFLGPVRCPGCESLTSCLLEEPIMGGLPIGSLAVRLHDLPQLICVCAT